MDKSRTVTVAVPSTFTIRSKQEWGWTQDLAEVRALAVNLANGN